MKCLTFLLNISMLKHAEVSIKEKILALVKEIEE
jgi:hypothetical protein